MLNRIDVTAFVDWQAQICNAGQRGELRVSRCAENTINYVTQNIADLLSLEKGADFFFCEHEALPWLVFRVKANRK